jgi:D-tyrosyl-tRNA(Tyr) deacylase
MKLVVQRVSKAQVTNKTSGDIVGKIDKGYLVLLGVGKDDDEKEIKPLVEKLAKLRVMSDSQDKMNLSLNDAGGEILVVSQFTLYADISGGNRPSFINAADGKKAKIFYELFIEKLKSLGLNVSTGAFGEYMEIEASLDGPVTIIYS